MSHRLRLSLLNKTEREVALVYSGRRLQNVRMTPCLLTFVYLDRSSNDHMIDLVHTLDARNLVENFALFAL